MTLRDGFGFPSVCQRGSDFGVLENVLFIECFGVRVVRSVSITSSV